MRVLKIIQAKPHAIIMDMGLKEFGESFVGKSMKNKMSEEK
jgi:hypothetical protein